MICSIDYQKRSFKHTSAALSSALTVAMLHSVVEPHLPITRRPYLVDRPRPMVIARAPNPRSASGFVQPVVCDHLPVQLGVAAARCLLRQIVVLRRQTSGRSQLGRLLLRVECTGCVRPADKPPVERLPIPSGRPLHVIVFHDITCLDRHGGRVEMAVAASPSPLAAQCPP